MGGEGEKLERACCFSTGWSFRRKQLVCRKSDQQCGFEEVLLCIAVHPGSSMASLRLNRSFVGAGRSQNIAALGLLVTVSQRSDAQRHFYCHRRKTS